MNVYFNINYELDKREVLRLIDQQVDVGKPGYVCVADGVILNMANRHPDYMEVINGSLFSICDSSYVPLYLKWIYGIQTEQYCGSDIFMDIIGLRKYQMAFLGSSQDVLDALKAQLCQTDDRINTMMFEELPFLPVEQFDYKEIARKIEEAHVDIIWVSLGAPKQEIFMSRLKPHLKRGVIIAVGAAFKFISGTNEKRAPAWFVDHHLEFVYRIYYSPKKQLKRCAWIVATLPQLLHREWRKKQNAEKS